MKAAVLIGTLATVLVTQGAVSARTLTASEKAVIREAVSDQFFDPDSAKYRWLPVMSKETTFLYCGSVNAKNRYGAYTGYSAFAVVVELKAGKIDSAVSMTSVREYDAEVWRMLCAEKGMDVRQAR